MDRSGGLGDYIRDFSFAMCITVKLFISSITIIRAKVCWLKFRTTAWKVMGSSPETSRVIICLLTEQSCVIYNDSTCNVT